MQKCEVCSTPFSTKQILTSVWLGYRLLDCSQCNASYQITFLSRIIWSVFSLLPALLLSTNLFKMTTDWSITYRLILTIMSFIGWIIIAQLFLPRLVRYTIFSKGINK